MEVKTMRISVEISSNKDITLPIQHNHILQAFIYDHLSDKDYRAFLHQQGYGISNKRFKLFTFSRLMGSFKLLPEENKIVFTSPVKLVVSAAIEQFITDLAETLIRSENCFMGPNHINLNSISVHKNFEPPDRVQIKMLSPMVAYTTLINNDRKYTCYYSPWKKNFVDIAKTNIIEKYKLIYGHLPSSKDFNIIPNGNQEKKFKHIITYKGTVIEAYAGIYWLKGNPELIKVAYDTGLGSKNAQGFGCWEVVSRAL